MNVRINPLEIVSEARISDRYMHEGTIQQFTVKSVLESLDSIEVLESHIGYSIPMIPVIQANGKYLVEHENVVKVMLLFEEVEGMTLSEEEIIQKLCTENNIEISDVVLVVESSEAYIRELAIVERMIENSTNLIQSESAKRYLTTIGESLTRLCENKLFNIVKKADPKNKFIR